MKVSFLDFWGGFDDYNNFFTHSLNQICDVTITNPDEADLIIFSCFSNENAKYLHKKRIFYTGENIRPNFNSDTPTRQLYYTIYKCDYALSFDFSDDERNIRLPLWMLQIDWFNKINYTNPRYPLSLDSLDNNTYYNKPKNKFACTVFNNISPYRMEIVNKLSEYKRVDCFGAPFGNNFDSSEDSKLNVISDYKFNICFENSIYPGYYTEKPIHAKYAGCVPIYWSDNNMSIDFNEKGFVNLYKFDNDIDKLCEFIIELDNNTDKYLEIKHQPLFNIDQNPKILYDKYILNLDTALRKLSLK